MCTNQKRHPAWAGRDTESRDLKTSYPFRIQKRSINSNPYYSSHEKALLVRMMIQGKCFSFEFVDPRHRFIYGWLDSFLSNFPENQHTPNWFISYLSETPWATERAGGKSYIMDIFRGLEVSNDYPKP